ncbi:hypothetical protein TSUD_301040 [Trifolium subterraneum]|uniref:Reverse transcriptase domain-containing protein n=1 Tax=Trifolium subterraneum TaxID=3900 RepID=A0A2Z6PG82_TRISU|nr:hypothetical protein TSUD_301040 [Trifolium subterraneum]
MTTSNSILWNGSKTQAFTPVRGLRQGDPLSPYLFVLCMERLGAMINKQVNSSRWQPMQIIKNGTKLSHLFFADDVLLFAKANTSKAQVISEVLDNFCAASGLKISHAKSKFCTSSGVARQTKGEIADCTQIQATDKFNKYLGFKMFHGKLIWEILQSPNKLWVRLFDDRYLRGQLPFNVKIVGVSVIWNSLAKAMHILRDGITLKIGDGNSSFWYDSWVFKEKLSSVVPFVDIHDTALKINEVWNNGEWNLQHLYTNIPQYVADAIKSLQQCIVSDLPDIWTWQNDNTGIYSTKDAYIWLLDPMHINNLTGWHWIWQLCIPANIQFFLWQLVHESIPTRAFLHHRHVCSTDLCPRCSAAAETIDHCLFLCADSVSVWNMCGLHAIPYSLQSTDRISWNDLVFNHHRESVETIVAKIHSLVLACSAAFNSPSSMGESVVPQRRMSWSRPAAGIMCLNVDGSLLSSKNSAGYGGLLRDNHGDFIWGYYGVAAAQNILYAEIMAIYQGLKLCWENGYRKVLCCSDSLLAVNLIRQGGTPHHRFANEIHNIRKMLENDREVVITHTLRE